MVLFCASIEHIAYSFFGFDIPRIQGTFKGEKTTLLRAFLVPKKGYEKVPL